MDREPEASNVIGGEVAQSGEVVVRSADVTPPNTNPIDHSYTFTWSYSRDELIQLSLDVERLNPESLNNLRRAKANYVMGVCLAVFFLIVGVVIISLTVWSSAGFSMLWWSYAVPFVVAVVIYFEARRIYKPYASRSIALRHENFADYFMSIFQNAPVTATISAERITVSTETSDRSTRWIGSAGFFTTPSAFLITSSLNEWLLCLPRSVVNPSEEERLAADLKRWFEEGQRKRLLAYLRNAPVACPKCSYNLKGITELTCPECGTPLEPASILR